MYQLFYPAIFQSEEIGFSVFFPDIEGCNTQGDTIEESYIRRRSICSYY